MKNKGKKCQRFIFFLLAVTIYKTRGHDHTVINM